MKTVRRHTATLNLPTLRLEGGLFLPDVLAKAAHGSARLQSEADYRLPKGLQFKDEIGRAFQIACAQWRSFAPLLERTDYDPQHAAASFITELLRDALAYPSVGASSGITLGEGTEARHYPITHWASAPGAGDAGPGLPIVVAPHTLGLDEPDSRFAIAGSGSRKKTAFQLAQELLNASPVHQWALVSNGKTLRLLRDAATLTRPSYLEIDLQDLLAGQRLAEFAFAWRLMHASRAGLLGGAAGQGANTDAAPPAIAWEAWREAGQEEGTRVRNGLRAGVTQALLTLGQGFVQHPANHALRQALQDGSLSPQDYFAQLLRLIYRSIFTFSVEERGLIPAQPTAQEAQDDPAAARAKAAAAQAYASGYALARLRDLALRRRARTRFDDLWQAVKIVFHGLGQGQPRLGLPALGGLFAAHQCPHLDAAQLTNADLLAAMHALRWAPTPGGGPLAPIDYRNMGTEELGSVYESLLELVPEVDLHARHFGFVGLTDEGTTSATVAGNDRKLTGSYYTPDSLVQQLIHSALDPVIAQRLAANPARPIEALLSIRVIDPACGSGHFLLAAARRLGEKLAQLRAPEGAVTPQAYRHALREVVGHCIYGVDRNPMALELCKVALWLEAVEPGKPLGFLDAHLRCGDALIGVHNLTVLRTGVPDNAFSVLKDVLEDSGFEGELIDDKEAAKILRKRNAAERATPILPLTGLQLTIPEELNSVIDALDADEDSVRDVETKREIYDRTRANGSLTWRMLRACDLWTAAFFSVKRPVDRPGQEKTPTSDTVWRFLSDPESLPTHIAEETTFLRSQYRFFHWPLEFPEVFRDGGFSVVLGNPPWETMSPDAKEYFAKHERLIGSMSPSKQKERIAELLSVNSIRDDWERHSRSLYAAVRFVKDSGRYRLFASGNLAKGDFNVYRQFVELALSFVAPGGAAAQIVPENLYNGANASAIRKEIFEKFRVAAFWGFENTREVWFKGVDSRMKFVLYSVFRGSPEAEIPVAFALNNSSALENLSQRALLLPVALMTEFSPDTYAVMEFSNQFEIDIAKGMYSKYPKLGDAVDGWPMWNPLRELDMGTDNELFENNIAGLPLYQGSMVTHHDYRAKGYVSGHGRNVLWHELPFGSSSKRIHPQWRVLSERIPGKISDRIKRYRIGFCDIARADDRRSLMAALIPANAVCGHKVPTIEFLPYSCDAMLLWLAVANSLTMDFIVRMKISLTMSMSVLASLPFPRKVEIGTASARAAALAARLSAVGPEMADFRAQLLTVPSLVGEILLPCEDPTERALLAAELDVVVARDLFGITRQQMEYLLDPQSVLGASCTAETFAALRRAEVREYGEYRTQRLVLAAWDAGEAVAGT